MFQRVSFMMLIAVLMMKIMKKGTMMTIILLDIELNLWSILL